MYIQPRPFGYVRNKMNKYWHWKEEADKAKTNELYVYLLLVYFETIFFYNKKLVVDLYPKIRKKANLKIND